MLVTHGIVTNASYTQAIRLSIRTSPDDKSTVTNCITKTGGVWHITAIRQLTGQDSMLPSYIEKLHLYEQQLELPAVTIE